MITIYHNPACGTSRKVLGLLRDRGVEPNVVLYLETPPNRAELEAIIAAAGVPVRELLRRKGTPYDALDLNDPKWRDEDLLDFMLAYPIVINRPIVTSPRGTRLCRPPEVVLDLLPPD